MIERNDIKLVVIFVMLGFILGPKITPGFLRGPEQEKPEASLAAVSVAEVKNPARDAFAELDLIAKSAIVYDMTNQKVVYEKSSAVPRPLASLTKIMTAYVARENLDASAVVTVESGDMSYEGNQDLHPGEKWSLGDLLSLTLISSSNKGAGAIAASVGLSMNPSLSDRKSERILFVNEMNARAKSLGFASMHFNDPTGLDFGEMLGGEGSAYDVALLFREVLKKYPDFLEVTARPELSLVSDSGIKHYVKNTNELASGTPGFIGGKTGYTELAGGNLAMVVDAGLNHPLAIVVLGSTKDGRFDDMAKLISAARETIASPQ